MIRTRAKRNLMSTAGSGWRGLTVTIILIIIIKFAAMNSPFLLYSDGKEISFEDITLYATAAAAGMPCRWMKLTGSCCRKADPCMNSPDRRGIGIDVKTGEMRLCEKGWAVAAFIPPAHTGLYLAAYETGQRCAYPALILLYGCRLAR